MDTALPNNVTKRACQDCRRRKIRCLHRQIEAQQEQPAQTPDRTINQDNFATMDRDYDYNTNKSSSTKRVRTGPQGQQPLSSAAGSSSAGPRSSSIPKGPQGQQPLPSAAGFSSSSIPKAAPVQAVFAGIPTTVPAPEDPVDMDDVEKFLSLLEVVKGIAKTPSDINASENKLLAILGKWNSVYTIGQNPATNVAEGRGLEVGRNLASLAISSKRAGLLKPLLDYFKELEFKAEENQRQFTAKDHEEYAEFGPISWVYMQLSQGRFAKHACLGITETIHGEGVFEGGEEKERRERLQAELDSHKAIEHNGGVVFGSGGGARGGFDFNFGGN